VKILLLLAASTCCAVAPRLAAADPASPPLQLKPKALVAPNAPAPFTARVVDEGQQLDFVPRASQHASSPSACGVESNLCWDPSDNRIVYKPARRYMPTFPGLTPENISVRRDRIVFRYSF
jgi:hypothetical protein